VPVAVADLVLVRPMVRYIVIVLVALCAYFVSVEAAGPEHTVHATTADGRSITVPPGVRRPWGRDIIDNPRPEFPQRLIEQHATAATHVKIVLDVSTGKVRDVVVLNSSGYPDYDENVIRALKQWRLRPGKWRDFDVYVGASAAGPAKR
jgi:TonB family protein